MSLELCVLGSGSGGNSTVIRSPQGTFLIDAGFGPRATAQRMSSHPGIGVDVPDIAAILLTHLDHDHFNKNWLQTILKHKIKIFCAHHHIRDILDSPEAEVLEQKRLSKNLGDVPLSQLVIGYPSNLTPFQPLPNVTFQAIHLAHDTAGSHGFLISCDNYRIGFATDLGHVPDALIDTFCGVDVLALESNYDPEMERTADRPWFLKQRVMGGKGHLSNDQALEAIRSILDRTLSTRGPDHLPRHIVLLHRSRQCNCPKLLHNLFTQDPRIAQILTFTHQEERTPWLSARTPRAQSAHQFEMAWA